MRFIVSFQKAEFGTAELRNAEYENAESGIAEDARPVGVTGSAPTFAQKRGAQNRSHQKRDAHMA